jgi:ATP-dependent DNA helicase DinG
MPAPLPRRNPEPLARLSLIRSLYTVPAMSSAPHILLPHAPVLVTGVRGAVALDPDGEFKRLTLAQAGRFARNESPLVCHGPAVAAKLGLDDFLRLDIRPIWRTRPRRC